MLAITTCIIDSQRWRPLCEIRIVDSRRAVYTTLRRGWVMLEVGRSTMGYATFLSISISPGRLLQFWHMVGRGVRMVNSRTGAWHEIAFWKFLELRGRRDMYRW